VPIVGASPHDAVRQFCDHFNRVLSTTITHAHLSPLYVRGNPFAIVELGTPPLQANWEEAIEESYRLFRAEFTQ
jgi:hypothetical protein